MANLISSEDKVKLFMNDCKNYEEQIDKLTKQKEILQSACRRAGVEIKELKDTIQKLEKIAAITSENVIDRLRDAENYGRTEDYTEDK
jgi:peptidoglycan hydrolase CwlO-like protein|tara:strand:- start:460 stop:723 length:264 start_codon:yes stop_codon:yes gene_type:complete